MEDQVMKTPRKKTAKPAEPVRPLTDRVSDRIAAATQVLDRRSGTTRSKRPGRPRAAASATLAGATDETRLNSSLRMVFREMGDAHREYRIRTGEPTSATVREAANVFKKQQDFASLVAVAATLDQLGILGW
jgi:hypothetical protein